MTLTSEQTIGEVAAASLGAVRVFEKQGIDYCCGGDRKLGDVCAEQGIDLAALEGEIEQAGRENAPQEKDWRAAPLAELIRHIVATHHEYLKLEMPRLNQRMAKVVEAHREKDPEMLPALAGVLGDLTAELTQHMHKEEMVLFPAIERFEAAIAAQQPPPPLPFGVFENPIHMMEIEHDSAGAALRRFHELTSDYELPDYACPTVQALYAGLRELELDLHQHIHLENNILFPRAVELQHRSS